MKNPHCKYNGYNGNEFGQDGDLVEAVGDDGEDEDAAEGREDPHPPGDARLPGLAGDHGGGDHVGLRMEYFKGGCKYF